MSPNDTLVVELNREPCDNTCQQHHPSIQAYRVSISTPPDASHIGYAKLYVLDKLAMETGGPCVMWQECQAFDDMHFAA